MRSQNWTMNISTNWLVEKYGEGTEVPFIDIYPVSYINNSLWNTFLQCFEASAEWTPPSIPNFAGVEWKFCPWNASFLSLRFAFEPETDLFLLQRWLVVYVALIWKDFDVCVRTVLKRRLLVLFGLLDQQDVQRVIKLQWTQVRGWVNIIRSFPTYRSIACYLRYRFLRWVFTRPKFIQQNHSFKIALKFLAGSVIVMAIYSLEIIHIRYPKTFTNWTEIFLEYMSSSQI